MGALIFWSRNLGNLVAYPAAAGGGVLLTIRQKYKNVFYCNFRQLIFIKNVI